MAIGKGRIEIFIFYFSISMYFSILGIWTQTTGPTTNGSLNNRHLLCWPGVIYFRSSCYRRMKALRARVLPSFADTLRWFVSYAHTCGLLGTERLALPALDVLVSSFIARRRTGSKVFPRNSPADLARSHGPEMGHMATPSCTHTYTQP